MDLVNTRDVEAEGERRPEGEGQEVVVREGWTGTMKGEMIDNEIDGDFVLSGVPWMAIGWMDGRFAVHKTC